MPQSDGSLYIKVAKARTLNCCWRVTKYKYKSLLLLMFVATALTRTIVDPYYSIITMSSTTESNKTSWQFFWDLQCPYSKKNWENYAAILAKFQDTHEFSIHLTSLLFHPQAFTAQCAANLVASKKGPQAKLEFINACYQHQHTFMNAAVGDAKKSEIDAIFADIANKAGVLDETTFTRNDFLANIHNWDLAIKPAWTEHKEALAFGVVGTPKSVIDGMLVTDSDSSWGPDEWAKELESIMAKKK